MPTIVEAQMATPPNVSPAYWLVGEHEEVDDFKIGLAHLTFAAMERRTFGRQKYRDMITRVMERNNVHGTHRLLFEALLSQEPEGVEELMQERRATLTKAYSRNPEELQRQIDQTKHLEPMLGEAYFLTPGGIEGNIAAGRGIVTRFYSVEEYGEPDSFILPADATTVLNGFGIEWDSSPDRPPILSEDCYGVYGRLEAGRFITVYDERPIAAPER